jgi:hypothetical protein
MRLTNPRKSSIRSVSPCVLKSFSGGQQIGRDGTQGLNNIQYPRVDQLVVNEGAASFDVDQKGSFKFLQVMGNKRPGESHLFDDTRNGFLTAAHAQKNPKAILVREALGQECDLLEVFVQQARALLLSCITNLTFSFRLRVACLVCFTSLFHWKSSL